MHGNCVQGALVLQDLASASTTPSTIKHIIAEGADSVFNREELSAL